uniref:Uncharacterized protein n=1 Tax=Nymphaea colorata TaxID=210225 RepID=A0A5K0ZQP6_9MAGN
MATMKRGAVKH